MFAAGRPEQAFTPGTAEVRWQPPLDVRSTLTKYGANLAHGRREVALCRCDHRGEGEVKSGHWRTPDSNLVENRDGRLNAEVRSALPEMKEFQITKCTLHDASLAT